MNFFGKVFFVNTAIDENVSHLFHGPVPHGDSMAGVEQVLDNATAHDAKAKEPKAQLARLDVLLPQDLAASYLKG